MPDVPDGRSNGSKRAGDRDLVKVRQSDEVLYPVFKNYTTDLVVPHVLIFKNYAAI